MNYIQLYADKRLTVNSLKKSPALKHFQFPRCKYSHHVQFSATNVMSLNSSLERDTRGHPCKQAIRSQLQHTTDFS